MSASIDDLVLYRCLNPTCLRQFFSTARDPVCPCGYEATLSECQDIRRTEHSMLEEVRALRRTIFMLVSAAGGRAEVSFIDMERAYSQGAMLDCYYDVERHLQVWTTHQTMPPVKSVAVVK